MWNLEYELIAILLLTAIIGLIMGRFLCKNGETEERLKKQNIITAFKSAQVDLKYNEDKVTEQSSVITKQNEQISQLEEKISNFDMNLKSSERQRVTLLENLKELEKYKSRFEALTKEFNLQSEMVEKLKNTKGTNIEEIEGLRTSVNVLEKNKQILETKEVKLETQLKTTLDSNKTQAENITELQQLNEKNIKKIHELTQDMEKKMLELTKLQSYKNDMSIDIERLSFLETEYESLAENFNKLIEERDDLLSRIRAISSVVGAVGVDNNN